MDLRFLRLRRLVEPAQINVYSDYAVVEVDTALLDKVYVNGVSVVFEVLGPQKLRIEETEIESLAITRSLYEKGQRAQALLDWRGGYMDGIEQLLFDLLRAMFSAGGLGSYLATIGQDTDIQDILAHVQVAAKQALADITNRQAGRRVPPSRRPVLFELTSVDAQGTTLALTFRLKTVLSNTEFSLWL